jgi:hypothetical protein
MSGHHHPQTAVCRRPFLPAGAIAAVAGLCFAVAACAGDALTGAAARSLVAAAAAKPSVHAERPEIDAALRAAGIPAEDLPRLWAAVDAAVVPGAGSRLDGFLFLTRDPEWCRWRNHFAEYLEISAPDVAPEAVRELRAYGGVITLGGVAQPTPELLAALDGFGGEDWGTALELPAMTELSPAAAAGLARTKCLLIMPALESLPVAAARALAAHEGVGVVLGGLSRLDPEAAAALARLKSLQGMLLPDLEVLESVPLAGRLAKQDHVFLPRVKRLTPEIARALAPNEGGELSLPGLESLPVDVARALAASGYFGITLPPALEPPPAAALAGHNGPLIIPGALAPRVETAAALARHPGEIRLPGLATLPADVAAALAPHEGVLVCERLTALPPATAAALAKHRGGLWLGGLRTIDAETARLLATGTGPLALPDLQAIAPRALAALLEKEQVELPPRDSLQLLPDPDGSRDDFPAP